MAKNLYHLADKPEIQLDDGQFNSEQLDAAQTQIAILEMEMISPSKENPYSVEDVHVKELADDIERNGLLEPLTVQVEDDEYYLLSGECRYTALQLLISENRPYKYKNIDTTGKVPVTIEPVAVTGDDKKIKMMSANIHRDLSFKEKENIVTAYHEILERKRENGEREKGREREIIASGTGISEYDVRKILKKLTSESDMNVDGGTAGGENGDDSSQTPEDLEKEKQKQYKKIKKQCEKLTELLENFDMEEYLDTADAGLKTDANSFLATLGDMLVNLVRTDIY